MIKLSRIVTQTVEFKWLKRDFTTVNQQYRQIRSRMADPMDECFWCNHKFADGEQIALAGGSSNGNKVLCQKCAEEACTSVTSCDTISP